MAELAKNIIVTNPPPSFLRSAISATIDWPLRVIYLRLQALNTPRISTSTDIPSITMTKMNFAGGVAWILASSFIQQIGYDLSERLGAGWLVGDVAGASNMAVGKMAHVISEWDHLRSAAGPIEAKQDAPSIFRIGEVILYHMKGVTVSSMLYSVALRTLSDVLTYPMATIMTRIAVQPEPITGQLLKYRDPQQALRLILDQESFQGLYNGFGAQCVSNLIGSVVPYFAFKIFEPVVDDLREAWRRTHTHYQQKGTGTVVVQTDSQKSAASKIMCMFWSELNQPRVLGLGLLSLAFYCGAMPLSYTFSLLSTRLRVDKSGILPSNYYGFTPNHTLVDMLNLIYDTEGAYGLFRGAFWKFLWSQLTTGAIIIRHFYRPTVYIQ